MPPLDDAQPGTEFRDAPLAPAAHDGRLVSIVVISFNYADYLATAIDSALAQTHAAVEVIVVDDGSTDGSREVVERYGTRVRAIFKANGGEVSASNIGFLASRGDIVLFLDSDDVLLPGAASRLAAAMRPGVAAIQSSVMTIDAAGQPLGGLIPPLPRAWTPARIRRSLLRTGNYPHPPTSGNAYARWFLERVMPVDPRRVRWGLDGLLNRAAALHGDVLALPEPLAGYRLHSANMGAADARLDPERVHFRVALDLPINEWLVDESRRLGMPLAAWRARRGFYFAQYRLVSLKLRPKLHPIEGDWLGRVVAAFLVAAAISPDPPLRKTILAAWGLAVAFAPRSVATRLADLRFSSRARPNGLEALLRRLRLVRRIAKAGDAAPAGP